MGGVTSLRAVWHPSHHCNAIMQSSVDLRTIYAEDRQSTWLTSAAGVK